MSSRRRRLTLAAVGALLVAALVATVVLAAGLSRSGHAPDGSALASSARTRCTVSVASASDAARALASAQAGATVCLRAGDYSSQRLALRAQHPRDVVLRAAPGAHVVTGSIAVSGSHLVVRGLWVHGEISLAAGSSFVTLDHNDISNAEGRGGEGVVFDTADCTVSNAPTWAGCEPQPPISDVTISGNRFHDIGAGDSEDAIHLDNWRRVRVTHNEFVHVVETGNHTDCLQSVFGGQGLVFDHNWEHDNDCQGFFVKDGDASDVRFEENLFVRDEAGSYADFAQIWNVHGLVVRHNTIWDGKGVALVADQAAVQPTATVAGNAIERLVLEHHAGPGYAIREQDNLFGSAPWTFRISHTDRTVSRPGFRHRAREDYRLAGKARRRVGIDWSPAAIHYGPSA